MEILLLLGLGAFLLSRTQTATQVITPEQQAAIDAAAAAASGVLQIENSRIRLPHIVLQDGREVIILSAEPPSGAFYKFVECKQPGGAMRILDIENKFAQYEIAKNAWIANGRKRRDRFIKAMVAAANLYQNTLTAHLQSCTNFNKQL